MTTAAIALLFFMHGAKLSREAIIAGGGHWRLHLWVDVQHLRAVSDSGCTVCLVETGNVTRCSTPVFSTCAFSRLPCSLQSPSRQWRAVTSRRRFVLRQHPACWGFSFHHCWLVW
ncbi:bile acid:sodium symporter [Escherichia coli]